MNTSTVLGPRRSPLDAMAATPTLSVPPPGAHRIVRGERPEGAAIALGPGEWLMSEPSARPELSESSEPSELSEPSAPSGPDDPASGHGAGTANDSDTHDATGIGSRDVAMGHGLCAIRLSGPLARPLIACGATIDVDPLSFLPGQSSATAWRGVYTVLHVVDVDTIDLYVYRSYAETVWGWLADAERGLRSETG